MKSLLTGIAAAGLMLAGTVAMAQDASTPPAAGSTMGSDSTMKDDTSMKSTSSGMQTKHQKMKDCMARMQAKNDGSTKDQMKTACKNEMKGAETTSDSMNK